VVGDGLVLTSYGAIVGADSVVVTLASGIRVSGSRVAVYDPVEDVSVLKVPAPTGDSLSVGSDGGSGQVVWLVGSTDCTSARTQRTRVASRETGGLQLEEATRGWDGAAVVNQKGEVVALGHSGGRSGLASAIGENLRRARSAATTGALMAVDQMSRRENQSYGTVVFRSDVVGSAARVIPLEKWQPPTAALTGSIPFTFSGPMGRYRADLLVSGAFRVSDTVSVIPGQITQATLALPTVMAPVAPISAPPTQAPPRPQPQAPAQQPAVHSGGGFPWGVILLLGAGGGAAALLLAKKPATSGGSITIHLPNP
jgi:hypothetical protein